MAQQCAKSKEGAKVAPAAAGHRQRLRRRFLASGLASLAEHEQLELLLTFAIMRKDVKALAKELLSRFGDLPGVLNAPVVSLEAQLGVGESAATLLKLMRELAPLLSVARKVEGVSIRTPDDLREDLIARASGLGEEVIGAVLLNQRNRILEWVILEEGIENRAQLYLKKLVRRCLDRRATGLILFHNHPAGDPKFSKQDIDLTQKLRQTLESLEIRLLDHLLLSGNEVHSYLTEVGF